VVDRGTVSARVSYTGRRDDIDFATFRRGTLPSYVLVNLAGELALLRRADRPGRVSLTLRADNVLDRQYQPFYGFRAPGATVLAGLRIDAGL
jgi:outer membrane receptor protein involved in Fe transport